MRWFMVFRQRMPGGCDPIEERFERLQIPITIMFLNDSSITKNVSVISHCRGTGIPACRTDNEPSDKHAQEAGKDR